MTKSRTARKTSGSSSTRLTVVRPGKAESDPICEDEKKEQTAGRRKAGGDAASACDQTCETIAIGRGILGLIEAPRPRVVGHVAYPF